MSANTVHQLLHADVRQANAPLAEPERDEAPMSATEGVKPVAKCDEQLAADLLGQDAHATAEARLLIRLMSGTQPILDQVMQAQMRIALELSKSTASPAQALKLAKALKEVTQTSTAMQRRQMDIAATNVSLRHQRMFMAHHGGGHGD